MVQVVDDTGMYQNEILDINAMDEQSDGMEGDSIQSFSDEMFGK